MKKVLIIEDEKMVRNLMKKKLLERGYEVEIAENGKIGVEKIKEFGPDLILLDIIMPEMNGFEVLRAMEEEGLSEIPVIIISNSGQPVEIDKVKEFGVEDWIIKTDFDPKEVINKVISEIGEPKNNN